MITCDLSLVKHKWNCAIVILAKPRLFRIVNPACCLRRRRRRIPISKREQIDHVIHPKDILYLLSTVQPHAIDRFNAIVLKILFSAISIAYVVRRAGFFFSPSCNRCCRCFFCHFHFASINAAIALFISQFQYHILWSVAILRNVSFQKLAQWEITKNKTGK